MGAPETWREDEGLSLKVPVYYDSSERRLEALRSRSDIPKVITMAEVAKHNKRDDLWIIVDGRAYDVTPFVETHPGGWLPMVNMGGKVSGLSRDPFIIIALAPCRRSCC